MFFSNYYTIFDILIKILKAYQALNPIINDSIFFSMKSKMKKNIDEEMKMRMMTYSSECQ